jgi:hypothetical protein
LYKMTSVVNCDPEVQRIGNHFPDTINTNVLIEILNNMAYIVLAPELMAGFKELFIDFLFQPGIFFQFGFSFFRYIL